MFENKALKYYEHGENYILTRLIISTLALISYCKTQQVKEYEMSGTCSIHEK
jgi:hypothetical protein